MQTITIISKASGEMVCKFLFDGSFDYKLAAMYMMQANHVKGDINGIMNLIHQIKINTKEQETLILDDFLKLYNVNCDDKLETANTIEDLFSN